MPNKLRSRTIIIALFLMLSLLAAGYLAFVKLVDLETYRGQIIAELEKTLKRPVTYKSITLSFSFGPAIALHGLAVKEPDNSTEFVTIEHLAFRLDLLPLLKKQLAVHGLVADGAVVRLERRSDGTFNFSDLLESSSSQDTSLKIKQIKLKHAALTFIDAYGQQKPLLTKFTDTDLFLENITRGSKGSFKLLTHLQGGTGGSIALNGKIKIAPQGTPLVQSSIDATIALKGIGSADFWPYYRTSVPFRKVAGVLDADIAVNGRLEEFSSSGSIALHNGLLDYQPVFKKVITSQSLRLKYTLELNKTDIILKTVEVAIDGADIKGSCAIRDYRGEDPRITAQAVTSRLDFAKFSQYIPYGIIVKDTAEWLEQHLTGGIYQIDESRLDGKISQILHMETGTNYNVFSLKARVEKGIVSYGSTVPTFNNIKGTLEMKGKDFSLHNMSGNFGTSPMTLEGKITDYPLDKPSGYPFKMVITPTKNELAWLIGQETAKQLAYSGNSTLTLAGEGFTSSYNLSGDWNLTSAAYSYGQYVAKPAGVPSQVRFKGSISPKAATLTALNYTLGGLSLDLAAKYTFEPSKALDLLINTNQFGLDKSARMSPFLSNYQASGLAQLSLRGTRTAAAGEFIWQGSVALQNASIRYAPDEKPVTGLTGTVSFADDSFESSQLTAKIGATTLTGKGVITSLAPVAFSASFTSPRIDLADFGFKSPEKNPEITKVKGTVSFKGNSLKIKALSGNLNSSPLNLTGTVSDIKALKADLAVTSPQLNIADLVLLADIEKTGTPAAKPAVEPTIKAVVRADKGTWNGVEFTKLNSTINLANSVLLLQPLIADVFGGGLSAKVKIDSKSTPTNYQVEFRFVNGSADELIDFFTANKREMTGVLSLDASLTASGENYDAIRKSAAGSLEIHSQKGMLRQFSMLSKVFSILNVSQLFKFRLPDMVSEGMPYNDLKATLTIKNGFVSTDNLFLASNAMNMSLIGKHDFVHDNMDLTLGVQPLQTVDKVVSHIPIVGWILTGKEKTMFSTYFEIKGKTSAPNVTAIPITSLGKGVLGIFKRVFQLPAKIFTDTGEVILGD